MSKERLECEWAGCQWISKEASIEICLQLLQLHVQAKHNCQDQSKPQLPTVKPEKAKRPEISSEMSDEDWQYFLSRWEDYKKATALTGNEVILQLMECCCESLRRDHHRTYPKNENECVTEELRLSQIKQLAVRQKNRMVNRVKLGTLKQDKGEPVRKFAGRIRSLATVSEYGVNCTTCNKIVFYTEPVIMDQLIAGLADLEIQKDVLSHPEAPTLTLEKLLTFVEGKESGQASQGLMSGNLVADVTKKLKCRFCGDQHQRGKQFCKAAGKKCEKCGKVGHFTKVCFSKPNKAKNDDGAPNTVEKEVKSEANMAWGYQDGNWACRTDPIQSGDQFENDCQDVSLFNSFKSFENKYSEFYGPDFASILKHDLFNEKQRSELRNVLGLKEVLKHDKSIKKVGTPSLVSRKEAIKKLNCKSKKVGQPTLVSNPSLMVGTVFTVMAASAILSSRGAGWASHVQKSLVTQGKLTHHVHVKGKGWVKRAAKSKPMILLQSRLDMSAYTDLQLNSPKQTVIVSEGYHLADTGASICLGGKQYMRSLGLSETDLTPCDMSVCGADSTDIKVLGAVLVELKCKGASATSKQVVYICEGVAGALLSLEACVDLGLVAENFPYPAESSCKAVELQGQENCECKCPSRTKPPPPPKSMPFEPTAENVKKLEDWIRTTYAASAFNCCECQPLPKMHGPPLFIHMKEGVTPIASHSPIPVPLHWQKKVKAGLDRDVAIGVLEKVPPGTPTTWCHRMVVVPKKDNTPRRTVNFQPLNQFSSRQTHHTMSPFHQASMC